MELWAKVLDSEPMETRDEVPKMSREMVLVETFIELFNFAFFCFFNNLTFSDLIELFSLLQFLKFEASFSHFCSKLYTSFSLSLMYLFFI